MIRNLVKYLTAPSYRIVEDRGRNIFTAEYRTIIWPLWDAVVKTPLPYCHGLFAVSRRSKEEAMKDIEEDRIECAKDRRKVIHKVIHKIP